MTIDSKLHEGMTNPRVSERYRKFLRLEVLPVMDARAESDFVMSANSCSDEIDVEILRQYVGSGLIKASGIFTYEDERVGTFFYSVLPEVTGGKSLMAVGLGAEQGEGNPSIYGRIYDAVMELAKAEGCKWIKTGSTRLGAIKMLLEYGMTPVRVDFCMEVK